MQGQSAVVEVRGGSGARPYPVSICVAYLDHARGAARQDAWVAVRLAQGAQGEDEAEGGPPHECTAAR